MSINKNLDETWFDVTYNECMYWLVSNNCISKLEEFNWFPVDENYCNMENYRLDYNKELSNRYPNRQLSIILKRKDCDDILCASIDDIISNNINVVMIHDFASSGWEGNSHWDSIADWYDDSMAWQW